MGYKELPIEIQILEEDWTVRDISFRQKLWIQILNGTNLFPLHHPHIRSNLAKFISNLVYQVSKVSRSWNNLFQRHHSEAFP